MPNNLIPKNQASAGLYVHSMANFWDFFKLLSSRSFYEKYEMDLFGLLQLLGKPLILAIVYTIFLKLGFNIQRSRFDYFLFVYSGLLPWLFFRNILLFVLESIKKNRHLITRVYFPMLLLPLSGLYSAILELFLGLGLMILLSIINGHSIGFDLFFLPLVILQLSFFSLGFGLIFLYPCVRSDSLMKFIKLVLPLLLFSLPVFYSFDSGSSFIEKILSYIPLSAGIVGFRAAILNQDFPAVLFAISFLASFGILILGLFLFTKQERKIVDLI